MRCPHCGRDDCPQSGYAYFVLIIVVVCAAYLACTYTIWLNQGVP